MSLLQIYESDFGEHSVEFSSLLIDLKEHCENYTKAKQTAQKERMLIIGKVDEFKSTFPQRSKEHRALYKAMEDEGWSEDVIYNNRLAYKAYRGLLAMHETHKVHLVLDLATVSHLMLMEQGICFYELKKYVKRHKKLPPISALRGRLGGFFDETFQPLSRTTTDWSRKLESSPSNRVEQVHQVEVVEHPTTTSEEIIEKTQADLRADFVSLIDRLNLEEAYVDPDFKKELQAREHQIEMLADWSKPALKGHVGRHLYV